MAKDSEKVPLGTSLFYSPLGVEKELNIVFVILFHDEL